MQFTAKTFTSLFCSSTLSTDSDFSMRQSLMLGPSTSAKLDGPTASICGNRSADLFSKPLYAITLFPDTESMRESVCAPFPAAMIQEPTFFRE
jgi:hypothetical protein